MSEVKKSAAEDKFLEELEKGVLKILKNRKASKADQLAAVNAGVRLAGIKHKVSSGDSEAGFFDK